MPHELNGETKHRSSRQFDLVGSSRELCARDPRGMNYLWAVELTPVPNVVRKGINVILIFDHYVEKFDELFIVLLWSPHHNQ